MTKPKWKKFEELVGSIQKKVSPSAEVIIDLKIPGKSGAQRQIDIAIKKKVGQFQILIVMDCKDHKDPIDIKQVEEFLGLVQDVCAQKGAMVASNGYTSAAKKRAEAAGIDLYTPLDTGEHNWKTLVAIPMVCDFRGNISYQITFRGIPGKPFAIPNTDPQKLVLRDKEGNILGEIDSLLRDRWNKGKLPFEPGTHEKLRLIEGETCIQCESELTYVNICINLFVRQRLYFGHLPLEEISGFKDEIKGMVITPGFKTKYLDVVEVQNKWKKISSLSDLAIMPFMILQALDSYQ